MDTGKLSWFDDEGVFSFYSHPEGQGLFSEFTSGMVTSGFTKILFTGGLAFNSKLSNQEVFYNDLVSGSLKPEWQLFFDFEEKVPMVSIIPGDKNWLFSLSISPDSNCWLVGYDNADDVTEFHIDHFLLQVWNIPPYFAGKIVSVTDPAIFGSRYC